MKYFLGGASGIRPPLVPDVAAFINYRLLSMHSGFKSNTKTWCAVSHHPKSGMKEVMLDSGAFTAFMRGHKTTLEELIPAYDEVIRTINPKLQLWFINLDVIPGAIERKDKAGKIVQLERKADDKEMAAALDESDKNYAVLRKKYGDRVLAVYHQMEGEDRLRYVLGLGSYAALGFRQDFAEGDRINNAQQILHIARTQMKSKTRLHGLATTGYKMLSRATFDTVDSASWLYCAAMGGILTSVIGKDGNLADLPISRESPAQRIPRGHFATLPQEEQDEIEKEVNAAGATLEQVRTDLSYRILVNAHRMREWMLAYNQPQMKVETGLFKL